MLLPRLLLRRRGELARCDTQDVELWYVAFDIIYIDDSPVVNFPLSERQQLLKDAILPAPAEGGAWPRGPSSKGACIAPARSHHRAPALACP